MRKAAARNPDLFFTYGTLMLTTGIAAVDEAMRNAGASLGRAYVPGFLYDLGDYPGAVATTHAIAEPDEDAPKVWGHLLRLADPEALFAVLDPYEGCEPGNPTASEFVRTQVQVKFGGAESPVEAQIYWYNFPVTGQPRIESGDFLAHWAAKGKPRQARIR